MFNKFKNKIIKIINQEGFNNRQWAVLILLLIVSIVIGN